MNTPFVEKYRPREWMEVIGNDWIKTVLKRMIENDTTQHMLFVGPPGCGKTTIARIFASKYLGEDVDFSVDHPDYRELNASDERGIDVVRGVKIRVYCRTPSSIPGKKRVLILEEADNMTQPAQRAMRAIMENNQGKVIIILVLNHLESIKEKALLSRVAIFKFDPQPSEKLAEYFLKIANSEEIDFESEEIVKDILNFREYQGDFRRIVNDTLQKLKGINKVVTKRDLAWIYSENYTDLIDKILSDVSKSRKTFFDYYRKAHVDPTFFIHQLFKAITEKQKISYELSKIFAETEHRIKNGADELIQLSYLLTGVEVES